MVTAGDNGVKGGRCDEESRREIDCQDDRNWGDGALPIALFYVPNRYIHEGMRDNDFLGPLVRPVLFLS